ncbi:hypothetical protein B0H13DRAFT_1946340 [Mycena leptocephala]|nr:hypothetical protein B0H13DRAFT_1946340 [Mycena leptocephala]
MLPIRAHICTPYSMFLLISVHCASTGVTMCSNNVYVHQIVLCVQSCAIVRTTTSFDEVDPRWDICGHCSALTIKPRPQTINHWYRQKNTFNPGTKPHQFLIRANNFADMREGQSSCCNTIIVCSTAKKRLNGAAKVRQKYERW